MRRTVNILFIVLCFLAACITPGNIMETRQVLAGDTTSISGYVYSLPMTSLRMDIEIVMTRTIRGPYYRFAEKYLSIKDVAVQNSTTYQITNVRLEPFEEADPENIYMIKQISGHSDISSRLDLGREGLIYDYREIKNMDSQASQPGNSSDGPVFTELSMERNTSMSIDTFYKTILTDTSFFRVPVLKEQLMVKTIDEKAEEAAEFILELRYERFMMLTGNNNTLVSDYGVQRLDEIERDYLELFIGKSVEQRSHYTYYITPSGDEVFENIEIFEFSEQSGILKQGSSNSQALSMRIRNIGKTNILKDSSRPEFLSVQSNALFYRVPDVAEIEISIGQRSLLTGRYPVCQYGAILSMPLGKD